jgi:hypothetical protein
LKIGGGAIATTTRLARPAVAQKANVLKYVPQVALEDTNADELNQWAPKILAKLRTLPQLADVKITVSW